MEELSIEIRGIHDCVIPPCKNLKRLSLQVWLETIQRHNLDLSDTEDRGGYHDMLQSNYEYKTCNQTELRQKAWNYC